ncbi:MAG: hypothetical protein ACUVXG_03600 [Anaerolineae bacterium]
METARDIAIIILAVESIVIGGLLIFLIFQVRSLVRLLREELKPILDSTRETVGTVRGTTSFLSETIVSPIVEVAGYVAGLRQAVRALAGRGDGGARRAPRSQSTGAEGKEEEAG